MPALRKRFRPGFTLFEVIVAMFIMLVGVLGVVSVFSAGLHARLVAQELVTSHELANMWADWIRFRMNGNPSAGAPANVLNLGALAAGAKGDFFEDTGTFNSSAGSADNPPTYRRNVYQNYLWEITACNSSYKPRWLAEDGSEHDWGQLLGGGSAIPGALGGAPPNMTEVELTIVRGARKYKFTYIFSGVGIKYGKL